MRSIEFHNRENEIKEIRNVLDAKPTLITFIYGPINSGKTELINQIIPQLPAEYAVFYINLRGRFIKSYEEFLDVLFEIDEERKIENTKEYAKAILKDLKIIGGIPIPLNLFEKMFERKDRSRDVFRYIETFMMEISKKSVPVLILDELQVIGDIKIDDFDNSTALSFLDTYGLSDREKEVALNYCGGKPVCPVELVNSKRREEKAKEMFIFRSGEIETRLKLVKELGDEITVGGRRCDVHYGKLVDALKTFVSKAEMDMNKVDEVSKRYLVKENILFVDPLTRMMKPQSRLNLLAIRELIDEKE